MKEFSKILKHPENLDAATRKNKILYSSAKVVSALSEEGHGAENVSALISLLIGAMTEAGKINEREYLTIYPALVLAFGSDYDFYSIKSSFEGLIATGRILKQDVSLLTAALSSTVQISLGDILRLYAFILTPTYGKLSIKRKAYLARLALKPLPAVQ